MYSRCLTSMYTATALAIGCSPSEAEFQPTVPAPGVVYTFPADEQLDVPVGARISVGLSGPVQISEIGDCSGISENPQGAFCVTGPDGAVDGTTQIVGDNQNIVHFTSDSFRPGTYYKVFAKPTLLRTAGSNLKDAPLITFRTRSQRPFAGERPQVLGVNGESPEKFAPGSDQDTRLPLMDFASIRILLTEPIQETTAVLGQSVRFVQTNAPGTTLPGTLLAQGIHLTFDPDEDLDPTATYQLWLSDDIIDLNGEALEATTFEFHATDSRGTSGLIPQTLSVNPTGPEDTLSRFSGAPLNRIQVSQTLLGKAQIDLIDSPIQAELGDPNALGGPIPFVIRKGQVLRNANLLVALGGKVPSGLESGEIRIHILADADGFLYRNPFFDNGQIPNEEFSPVYALSNLDIGVTAADEKGQGGFNQTILQVRKTGTAVANAGSLLIELSGAMEFDVLGAAKAATNVVIRLGTAPNSMPMADTEKPRLLTTYPAADTTDFRIADGIELLFSEPIDQSRLEPNTISFLDEHEQPVGFSLRPIAGALVLFPTAPLAYSTRYSIRIGEGVFDLAGNAFESEVFSFSTPGLKEEDGPPVLTALYPGVPCRLVDAEGQFPGRCDEGDSDDDLYRPFSIGTTEQIEANFDQPIDPATLVLGRACGKGTIRVEQVDSKGDCESVVTGTLLRRERGFRFLPNHEWETDKRYELTLAVDTDNTCDTGDICGENGLPLNTDALDGNEKDDSGGDSVVIPFSSKPNLDKAYVPMGVTPFSDQNGNGFLDSYETPQSDNRVALRITDTNGLVTSAELQGEDCIPGERTKEACLYVSGSLPVHMGEAQEDCVIPTDENGGTEIVSSCIPVTLSPTLMYATSIQMDSNLLGIGIINNKDTGKVVIRIRNHNGEPPQAFIVETPKGPELVTRLDLYKDAPDLSLPLSKHDLRSKEITVHLKGPLTFTNDGRFSIQLQSTHEVNFSVDIKASLGLGIGGIDMQIPSGEMRLKLMSRQPRGSEK